MSGYAIPEDYLNDLSSRFIINIPEEEKRDPVRLFFQLEQAYWFYLDFHCEANAKLKNCGIKEFFRNMIRHIPSCSHLLKDFEAHYDNWRSYKTSVPTYGAILLNEDLTKVLLVQSYFEKTSWGFPKGKVNEDEPPVNCAVREVFEEVGCDISATVRSNIFLEAVVNEQIIRLYVVPGIKESTVFSPQTRMEIKKIEWFPIKNLPLSKKDQIVKPNGFFMVIPFVRKLRAWVEKAKATIESSKFETKERQRTKSTGDVPFSSNSAGPFISSKMAKKQRKLEQHRERCSDCSRDHASVVDCDETFVAPSWLNFKLDPGPILACFDDWS